MKRLEVYESTASVPQRNALRRLKIAFVVHDYHRSGGHSRYVAELATRFSEDHEVHVFANTFESTGAPNVRFHRVPAWRLNALTTILSFAVPAALRVGRDFDIVHVQGYCGPQGNVVTTHMCNEAWYRALSRYGESATWRDRIFNFVTAALEEQLYRRAPADRVIAISRLVARNVSELYHCATPMHIIYHGVDLVLFSPAMRMRFRSEERLRLGIPLNETVFLFVGNLRKGANECIRALARLDSGVLLFVSPTPAEKYRLLADQLGCAHRAKFLGASDHIERIYAAADVFVFPTPYDAFGLVITEAMACGLPVIVSREAGAAELIRDGENGLLLDDPADHQHLAVYMERLQSNRVMAAELGRSARRAVEDLSWDAVAGQTMRVYHQASAQGRS